MKQEILKQQLDQIVQEVFPDETRAPADFQAKLVARMQNPRTTAYPTSHRLRVSAVTIMAIFILGAIFLATPVGNTWAQRVFSLFVRGENDTMPGVTQAALNWVEQSPGEPAATHTPRVQDTQQVLAFAEECGQVPLLTCGIEDIRARVNFPIYQLAEIPQGWRFAGVTGSPDWIFMRYETETQSASLVLTQELWQTDTNQLWGVGESATIDTVMIGNVKAEYVKGSYDGNQSPPIWNPDLHVQNLRWVDNGILFTIVISGEEPGIDRNIMVTLAENLTAEVVQTTFVPDSGEAPQEDPIEMLKERFSMTIDQAAAAAGITVHTPTLLPDIVRLLGARYEDDLQWVTILYIYDPDLFGPNTNGVALVQMTAPDSDDCSLCRFVPGDGFDVTEKPYQVVPPEAIENVMIGDMEGQYVMGVWKSYTESHGWTWSPDTYVQNLRWQADGMAYELSVIGLGITQADMILIAESIH